MNRERPSFPKFAFSFFLLPLILILLIVNDDPSLAYELNFAVYFFLYCVLILFLAFSSLEPIKNQGYLLLAFLLSNLLLIALFPFFLSSTSIEIEIEKKITLALQFLLLSFNFSFFAYFFGNLAFFLVARFYKWLHKEVFELETDSQVSIEVEQNEEFFLTINDFSFNSFNRFLKVHGLWAIIPLAIFPFSRYLTGLTVEDPLVTSLILNFFIISIIGLPLGLVHYKNHKKRVKFALISTSYDKKRNTFYKKEINLSDDLKSFLKIGLVLVIASKLIDLVSFLTNTIDISVVNLLVVILFLVWIIQFELIVIYFCYTCHTQILQYKQVKIFLDKYRNRFHSNIFFPIIFAISLSKRIKEKISNLRKTKRIWPLYYILLIFYYGLSLLIFYTGVFLSLIYFCLIVLAILLFGAAFTLFGILFFPFIIILTIISYIKIRIEFKKELILTQKSLDEFFPIN